jgi:hypothetical protein
MSSRAPRRLADAGRAYDEARSAECGMRNNNGISGLGQGLLFHNPVPGSRT